MELIDTHAHIYLPEFEADLKQVIDAAKMENVSRILMPAIDNQTHAAMLATQTSFPQCISMMGLHPCSVKKDFLQELEEVQHWLSKQNFVAVGEIGLDFYWDVQFKKEQYEAFERQIDLALSHRLPIVIHSRNATRECIDVVRNFGGIKGVFHCFSGTQQEAEEIISLGFYLGIGGVVTFKNAGLDKIIAALNLEHLVLETDAPYLAPVPYRGKRNQSAYLTLVAHKVAQITGCSVEKVAAATTANAKTLFGLQ